MKLVNAKKRRKNYCCRINHWIPFQLTHKNQILVSCSHAFSFGQGECFVFTLFSEKPFLCMIWCLINGGGRVKNIKVEKAERRCRDEISRPRRQLEKEK